MVLFGPPWSHLVFNGPIWFAIDHLMVLYGPFRPLLSTYGSFSIPLSWRVPYELIWLSVTCLINHGLILVMYV